METQDYLNKLDVFQYLADKLREAGFYDDELDRLHVGAIVGSRPGQWAIGCWPKERLEAKRNDRLSRLVRAYAVLKWAKNTPNANDENWSAAFEYADQTVMNERSMQLRAGRKKGAYGPVKRYLMGLVERNPNISEDNESLWKVARTEAQDDDESRPAKHESPFELERQDDFRTMRYKGKPWGWVSFQKRMSEVREILKENSAFR